MIRPRKRLLVSRRDPDIIETCAKIADRYGYRPTQEGGDLAGSFPSIIESAAEQIAKEIRALKANRSR